MSAPTNPPSGFRDFTPDSSAYRSSIVAGITEIYRSFGFSQITTSCVEDLSVLLGKGGGENEKLIFKILKRGEKLDLAMGSDKLADLGLRFDLTLPLARYYSRHQGNLPKPFKAFQIGPVFRAERAQKGRFREFVQCDVDIIGSEDIQCEVDVIQAMGSVFQRHGIETKVLLNDRNVLFALFEASGVPAAKHTGACILLDKLDKVKRDIVMDELIVLAGLDAARKLENTVFPEQPHPESMGKPALEAMRKVAPEAMIRLESIIGLLNETGKGDFSISPSLVRGLDYYTGPVFEFRHPELSGSLGGGGRYDRLTRQFGGQNTPACGGSIGFERLMMLLEAAGAERHTGPDVCMTVFADTLRERSLRIASSLRAEGLSVDVYPGTSKLKAQFKYADSTGARFALVIGPDEAAAHKVKIKDLKSGEEQLVDADAVAPVVKNAPGSNAD